MSVLDSLEFGWRHKGEYIASLVVLWLLGIVFGLFLSIQVRSIARTATGQPARCSSVEAPAAGLSVKP
jgi:hypothetical protein